MKLIHKYLCAIIIILYFMPAGALKLAWAEPATTIRNNGDPSNRVDLVILGDGYTVNELNQYAADVANIVSGFFGQEPFIEYQNYFNVHRIDVISNESGADHPPSGIFKDTAFDSAYNCSGIPQLICYDISKVTTVLNNSVTPDQRDIVLVIVNDAEYGGAGGSIAVASTHPATVELVLHEIGHSFGALADEYDSGSTCFNNVEPIQPNVTMETDRNLIKWNVGGGPPTGWIDPATPVPTTGSGPDPGLFEGAKYCPTGLYRPTFNSKMRSLNRPFGPINEEQLVKRIYNWVSPLDSTSPSVASLALAPGQQQVFQVGVPQPQTHVLQVDWYLDGNFEQSGIQYVLDAAILSPGSHVLEVVVWDPTAKVRYDPADVLSAQNSWTVSVNALQFSTTAYSVAENGTQATITVTRTGGSFGATSVDYATANGTATAGADYTATSGTVNFADGDTAPKTFTVPLLDDTTYEGNETVNLSLTNAVGAGLGTPSTAVLTITEDDPPPPAGSLQFSTSAYSVAENGTQATITVTRTGGSQGAASVDFATSDGTATARLDYTAAFGTINFIHGDTVPKTWSIFIVNDGILEGDETVNLSLTNAIGASLGTPSSAVLTIIEDDLSPPASDPSGPYNGTAGSPVSFDGSGSSDLDGTLVSYAWNFGDGGAGSGINPIHAYAAAGFYTVTLTVTDNDGLTDSATTTADVQSVPNRPPVADAGLNQTALVSELITLDGSGSSDPDGDPLNFIWTFDSRPVGSNTALDTSDPVFPTFVVDVPGTYVVQLIVNDTTLDSAPDTVRIITHNPAAGVVPAFNLLLLD